MKTKSRVLIACLLTVVISQITLLTQSQTFFKGGHVRMIFAQGPLYPSTVVAAPSYIESCAHEQSQFYDSNEWSDPANAATDDGDFASYVVTAPAFHSTAPLNSTLLVGSDFEFSIPSGAKIVGILIEAKGQTVDVVSGGYTLFTYGFLRVADSCPAPPAKLFVWPAFGSHYPDYEPYGELDDLFGSVWSPANINSPDFSAGIITAGRGYTLNVHAIRVTIFFESNQADVFETKPPFFQPHALANIGDGFFHIEPGDSIEDRRRKLNAGFTLAEYRINLIERVVEAGKIVPPQGDEGVQGARGGNVGAQGSQGHQGGSGSIGTQGGPGSQGSVGVQGSQGNRGQPGNYGVIGDIGAQGVPGTQGSPGVQGTIGTGGSTGGPGSQGVQGSPGIQGPVGPSGAGTIGYAASSTSSVLMNAGSRTFATQTGLAYAANQRVRLAVRTSPSIYMEGIVTSYSGSSLVISVDRTSGFGTFADWTINLAGEVGLTGEQGEQGVPGGEGPQGDVGVQGPDGSQGSQGTGSSPVGVSGAQGPVGANGPDGREGRRGRDDHGFGS